MQRTTAIVVSVAILAVALIGAAFLFTHKPNPEPAPVDRLQHAKDAEIACLEGGGTWNPYAPVWEPKCEHSEPTTAAPPVEAPSTSDSGGSSTQPSRSAKEFVGNMTIGEIGEFCGAVQQGGYAAGLSRVLQKGLGPSTTPSAEEVYDALLSHCVF
jgi:hypothetical protein